MALTKEEKAAVTLAVTTLKQAQAAEIVALKTDLAAQGLTSSEINKAVSAEKKANTAELTAAKTASKVDGASVIPTASTATTYSGQTAYNVANTLSNAAGLYSQYGISPVTSAKASDNYIGIPLDVMVKASLNQDTATGLFTTGSGATKLSNTTIKTLNNAISNYGTTISSEEAGKVKSIGTDTAGNQLFSSKITSNGARTGYQILSKNPDGSYKVVGTTASTIPAEGGGFFSSTLGKIALGVGAALTGGALAPYVGAALGTGATASGAIAGGLTGATASGITGGNVLTGALLGGAGGAVAAGGVSGISDSISKAFSDITGLNVGDIKNVFSATQGTSAAEFAAADALTMAQNGLGTAAIQQNLIASGMDSLTAATLANNAVMSGATVGSLASTITNQPLYNNVAGMLTGGDAFATTDSVYKQLVANGMTPADAAQVINTTGGGLGLNNVSVDSAGNLIQAGAAATGLLGGGASDTVKNLLGSSTAGNIAGGLLGGAAGIYGANADKAALEKYAAELKAAAAKAAPQMQFQPIGMTTRFGSTTTPQYDANGRLIGYGYTPAADIAAQRDKLLTLSGEALPTTTNLTQATTDYYNQLQALQQPGREQQLAGIKANLQATGRAGLGLGATTGVGGSTALAATNPELAAYYNALAQTQAQQALTAQDVAQQRLNQQIATSGNLFGKAQTLESAAQQPMTLGTNLGTLTTAGSTNAANAQLQAAQLAAQLQSQGALGVNRATTSALTGLAPAAGNILGNAATGLFNSASNYFSNLV